MANGLTIRSSIEGLENTPGGLDALRDAYSKMQQISDNRGWLYWSGIHGFPQYMCWHHGRVGMGDAVPYNLFLPWHRAYLLYFEHTARDQNNAVALPWWDWTSPNSHQVGIPKSYSDAQAGGGNNPLAAGPMPAMPPDGPRSTTRNPDDPGNLPTPDDVNGLMSLGNFVDFTTQLEDLHDRIHGWVSGDMGVVATSAYDPIFWAHHCMIDRIWYLWQLQNGVNSIPADYLDKPLAPFALTVRDVLDVNRLGYDYAQTFVTVNA
ncbi:MAG TPA: tyrosinase family protein [Candidatus Angelobacter sp.]|nr:tyrosinase family protein [Candidatus Angelobacter sp.]